MDGWMDKTNDHVNNLSLSFLQARCSSRCPVPNQLCQSIAGKSHKITANKWHASFSVFSNKGNTELITPWSNLLI